MPGLGVCGSSGSSQTPLGCPLGSIVPSGVTKDTRPHLRKGHRIDLADDGTRWRGSWALKSNGNLKIENNTGTTVLQVNDTATGGKTWSLISSGNGNAHSIPAGTFYLRNSSDSLTALSVTSGGNVGIGSISPSEKLEVQDGYLSTYHSVNLNGAGYGIQFYTNGGGSKNSLAYIGLSQVGTARTGDLLFATSNAGAPTTKMTLDASGRLGIGETSPSEKLHLKNSSGTGNFIRFQDTAGGGVYIGGRSENMELYAGNAERMRITSDGNIGFGVTPAAWGVGANYTGYQFKNASLYVRTSSPELYLNNNSYYNGTNWKYLIGAPAAKFELINNEFLFSNVVSGTANSNITWVDVMRITSAGKIEMGNTSISGEVAKITGTRGLDNYLSVYSGTIHMFLDADATNSSGIVGTQSNHNLILRTNGTNKVWITTGGQVQIGGSTGTYLDISGTVCRLYGGSSTDTFGLGAANTIYYQGDSLRLYPTVDNSRALGLSNYRYTAVWAVNGTIQTSDEREKTEIATSDLGLDFITKLRPVSYKWKVGQNIETTETTIDGEGN